MHDPDKSLHRCNVEWCSKDIFGAIIFLLTWILTLIVKNDSNNVTSASKKLKSLLLRTQ